MSKDNIIKYATGYVKGKVSIVTLERKSRYNWWVRIESDPYTYDSDLFWTYYFANKRFWKLVYIYGLDTTQFQKFDINKKEILSKLSKLNHIKEE